ncbi:hypothetical protein SAMN02745216_04047 [Desulfatibacillum alkenivorans DSM 16219]|jgi:hypothetical protein|uniref:Uncharacterized protein n=1 Tax=Desulfatibacillum alkenivorans DSM 16219 TaxID=1121393 RepID=A0A1M6V5Q4_9BACT|nr:hypothetical protein [Desulfatibacillum alkenivorans]SHK76837.1 hypothetical protein SAMN02745216_04047 [Desulfatibacillum alkenivorans DSM 16219]
MKLDDFIENALVDIASGIKKAQEKYKSLGGQVNPTGLDYKKIEMAVAKHKKTSRIAQAVEFEIAVSAGNKVQGSGKAGIQVLDVGISGKVEGANEESNVSKIRFSIPVIFPKSVYSEDENEGQGNVR